MICKIILMIIFFSLHLFFAIIKLKLDYILTLIIYIFYKTIMLRFNLT